MSEHSGETEENIKVEIRDDCMESDPIKEINFLLASSKNMKIEETPVFNIRLIAEVKSRPYLYDQSDEGYNLLSWRNSAWNEIADTLETTPEHVKTRWKTLRDRYKKEEKKERLAKKASSWVFQRPLKFIQAHLKDRHFNAEETENVIGESGVKPDGGHVSPMEAAMNFIENELIRNHEGNSTSSSVENSSAASTSSTTSAKNPSDTVVSTTPPLPIPMASNPSPSSSSSTGPPSSKRSRISTDTQNQSDRHTRNSRAVATLAANLGITNFIPPATPNQWEREEEEDEIFAKMISIKLSKLDPRTKELAKMQVLKAIFDAQFSQ